MPHHPFTKDPQKSIGALGESALLRKIEAWLASFPRVARPTPRGIGDDCAALPELFPGATRLVTTDSVIFSKHFDAHVSARDAGAKLIKRNASDIAAMGGMPSDAVLSLIMSRDTDVDWLAEFYAGLAASCDALGIELAGGDLASAPAGAPLFAATLALTGFCRGDPLLRSGAQIGDGIFVTGTLGGSILKKHFDFEPRLEVGQFLASFPRTQVRGCMDITDGLAKDLAALIPEGAHANVDFSALPISEAAQTLADGNREGAIRHAWSDGEDYELVFCVAPHAEAVLRAQWQERFPSIPLTRIGQLAAGAPSSEKPFESALGYEHFS